MKETIITILLTAIITAISAELIKAYIEKRNKQNEILFDIHMKLMELNEYYFWAYSFETKHEEEPQEIKSKIFNLRWIISDMCRKSETKYLNDILEILFLKELNNEDRYQRLNIIINKMGYKINSKYKIVMNEIQNKNEKLSIEKIKNSGY